MPRSEETNCEPSTKCGFIPKHLYDVKIFFPAGVGKCSIKDGPKNDVSKETKDWLSKVTFNKYKFNTCEFKSLKVL